MTYRRRQLISNNVFLLNYFNSTQFLFALHSSDSTKKMVKRIRYINGQLEEINYMPHHHDVLKKVVSLDEEKFIIEEKGGLNDGFYVKEFPKIVDPESFEFGPIKIHEPIASCNKVFLLSDGFYAFSNDLAKLYYYNYRTGNPPKEHDCRIEPKTCSTVSSTLYALSLLENREILSAMKRPLSETSKDAINGTVAYSDGKIYFADQTILVVLDTKTKHFSRIHTDPTGLGYLRIVGISSKNEIVVSSILNNMIHFWTANLNSLDPEAVTPLSRDRSRDRSRSKPRKPIQRDKMLNLWFRITYKGKRIFDSSLEVQNFVPLETIVFRSEEIEKPAGGVRCMYKVNGKNVLGRTTPKTLALKDGDIVGVEYVDRTKDGQKKPPSPAASVYDLPPCVDTERENESPREEVVDSTNHTNIVPTITSNNIPDATMVIMKDSHPDNNSIMLRRRIVRIKFSNRLPQTEDEAIERLDEIMTAKHSDRVQWAFAVNSEDIIDYFMLTIRHKEELWDELKAKSVHFQDFGIICVSSVSGSTHPFTNVMIP